MGDYKEIIGQYHQRQMDKINKTFDKIEDGIEELETLTIQYGGLGKDVAARTKALEYRAEHYDQEVLPRTQKRAHPMVTQNEQATKAEVSQQPREPFVQTSYALEATFGLPLAFAAALAIGAYFKKRRV